VIAVAIGFVIVAIAAGSFLAPHLVRLVARLRVSKALFFGSLMFALTLAWCAQAAGSAVIIGAFAAGLVLARTEKGADIEHETHDIAQFFVPIFFVLVGAAVDLRQLNPFDPAARRYLLIGALLTLVGIAGKLIAGYAAPRRFRRIVIGVGMIPRGEVGLIFAQIGITAGLLSAGLYSSVALMVMLTTFITPPLLRLLLPGGRAKDEGSTLQSVVTESLSDTEPR
jgi:Kef-type K+ transport system membrane component KefB